jgi:hypothetical protein
VRDSGFFALLILFALATAVTVLISLVVVFWIFALPY